MIIKCQWSQWYLFTEEHKAINMRPWCKAGNMSGGAAILCHFILHVNPKGVSMLMVSMYLLLDDYIYHL